VPVWIATINFVIQKEIFKIILHLPCILAYISLVKPFARHRISLPQIWSPSALLADETIKNGSKFTVEWQNMQK